MGASTKAIKMRQFSGCGKEHSGFLCYLNTGQCKSTEMVSEFTIFLAETGDLTIIPINLTRELMVRLKKSAKFYNY